jgi:hypothetical protein
MVFQMLLCGEHYENLYSYRRTSYPSTKVVFPPLVYMTTLERQVSNAYAFTAIYEITKRNLT